MIILIFVGLMILCIGLCILGSKIDSEELTIVFAVIGCFVFIIIIGCIIGIPIGHANDRVFIREYQVTIETVKTFREAGRQIENAALITSIIEMNQRIANNKYWADSKWVGVYYTDEIKELELIK